MGFWLLWQLGCLKMCVIFIKLIEFIMQRVKALVITLNIFQDRAFVSQISWGRDCIFGGFFFKSTVCVALHMCFLYIDMLNNSMETLPDAVEVCYWSGKTGFFLRCSSASVRKFWETLRSICESQISFHFKIDFDVSTWKISPHRLKKANKMDSAFIIYKMFWLLPFWWVSRELLVKQNPGGARGSSLLK